MSQVYHLSAASIIYSVISLKRAGIYGVQNILDGKSKEEISVLMQDAEMELMAADLGTMDFDGSFALEDAFCEAISACADAAVVWSGAKRISRKVTTVTVYCGETIHVMEQLEDGTYQLYTVEDPIMAIENFLKLPLVQLGTGGCVPSRLVQKKDLQGIKEAGCSEELAQLVVNAASGVCGYAQVVCVEENQQTALVTLIYDAEAIISVDVEYTMTDELLRLTPVDCAWVKNTLSGWRQG